MNLCYSHKEMANTKSQGREAEDKAAQFLIDKGYTLISRRFHSKNGEIDLIALDEDTLVFIEVKFRNRGVPEVALDHTKMIRFSRAAQDYLVKTQSQNLKIRFDLIAVTPDDIRHHKGAFHATD